MSDEPDDRTILAPVHLGEPVNEWCSTCLTSTLHRSSIYALTPNGPLRIGEWALCEKCGRSPYATTNPHPQPGGNPR